jgi:excisionase family DNA binding protein
MNEQVRPEAISVQTAAALLDVHENTIYNWIKAGVLVAVRTGPRLVRIPRSEISRLRTSTIRPNAAQ